MPAGFLYSKSACKTSALCVKRLSLIHICFAVENKTLSALNIRESDFWQPGTRAVMFSQPASQLLAGARMDVYVIRDGEGN